MFVDRCKIHVKAGDGGNGCAAFRREKYVPRGGPSGGNGGQGGSIFFRATPHLNNLLSFKYRQHFNAGRGGHGSGNNRYGKSGNDLIIEVPVGTEVQDEYSGETLLDLGENDQVQLVAKGGRGGRGNASFTSSTNQAPTRFEVGNFGEEHTLILELKILADVGIIGYPNAGKSTLISVLSAAKPQISEYPFTTLTPNLGVVEYGDHESFVMADIPGLIEGAHSGSGLGSQFLRHVERTRLLLHLVDVSGGEERDSVHRLTSIRRELELYDSSLTEKPQIIAASKVDAVNLEELGKVRSYCQKRGLPLQEISSVSGEGLKQLRLTILQYLQRQED